MGFKIDYYNNLGLPRFQLWETGWFGRRKNFHGLYDSKEEAIEAMKRRIKHPVYEGTWKYTNDGKEDTNYGY